MAATRRRVERTDPLRRGALKATATSFPLVAVALLGAAGPARSQGTDRYVFTTYGMEEGLSHGTVEAIVQDSTGFLWIGTHGGVDRFDGRDSAPSGTGATTRRLWPATTSSRWRGLRGEGSGVGTEDGGLDLLDPLTGVARHFGLEALGPWSTDAEFGAPTRGGRTVWKIAAADDGSLVVFTDAGFAWFDPVTERYGSLSDSTAPLATALCGTSGRGVFVGFADGTIRQLTSVRPDAGSTRPVDGAVLATLPWAGWTRSRARHPEMCPSPPPGVAASGSSSWTTGTPRAWVRFRARGGRVSRGGPAADAGRSRVDRDHRRCMADREGQPGRGAGGGRRRGALDPAFRRAEPLPRCPGRPLDRHLERPRQPPSAPGDDSTACSWARREGRACEVTRLSPSNRTREGGSGWERTVVGCRGSKGTGSRGMSGPCPHQASDPGPAGSYSASSRMEREASGSPRTRTAFFIRARRYDLPGRRAG